VPLALEDRTWGWSNNAWQTWTNTNATWSATSTSVTWTTNANASVWNGWITSNATTTGGNLYLNVAVPTEPSEEQRERWRAEEQERLERYRERAQAAEAAAERARETLRELLSAEQWEQYEREQLFELVTQSGRRYRIKRGVSGNVKLIEQGVEVESLCAHPPTTVVGDDGRVAGALPTEDVLIAQVLALGADEDGFRRVANISDHRGRYVHVSEGRQAA
jgi:hypothetical protein